MLTIHGRTREEKGHHIGRSLSFLITFMSLSVSRFFSLLLLFAWSNFTQPGPCDWDTLKRINEHFRDIVPVIANGGVETFQDVKNCLDKTGYFY